MDDRVKLWCEMAVDVPDAFTKTIDKGGYELTDISPAYDWQLLTRLCGPAGSADTWGFDYDTNDLEVRKIEGKNRYIAVIKKLRCWLNYDGKRYELSLPGGSENSDPGDALKGAITSAFSKFVAHFGRGFEIYSGQTSNQKGATESKTSGQKRSTSRTTSNQNAKNFETKTAPNTWPPVPPKWGEWRDEPPFKSGPNAGVPWSEMSGETLQHYIDSPNSKLSWRHRAHWELEYRKSHPVITSDDIPF